MIDHSKLMVKIKVKMREKRISQKDLAGKLGLTQGRVSFLLSGSSESVNLSTLSSVCDSIGVKAWKMIKEVEV